MKLGFSTLLGASILASTALAQEDSAHREAAYQFYREARLSDVRSVAQVVAEMLVKLDPSLAPHRDVIEAYAIEVVSSERYTDARVEVYMEMFPEEDLRTLTWLFRHATFQKYRDRRVELLRRNTEVTMNLFRAALPELERRIRSGADRKNTARE